MVSLKRCKLDFLPQARHWMLTFGDEDKNALRITRGSLDKRGKWHRFRLDIFRIRDGKRV